MSESIYDSMFPTLAGSMSDAPAALPTEPELTDTALTHQESHLRYDQPGGATKSEYYQGQKPNGVPDREYREPEGQNQQAQTHQVQNDQAQDADFWYIPENVTVQEAYNTAVNKLYQVRDYLSSGQYEQEIRDYQERRVQEINQELEDFGIAYQALRSNPRDFMIQYLPEVLMEFGISPVMSQEQIAQKVQESLQQAYGQDYRGRIDPNELFVPGSYSSMVYQHQQNLYQQYAEQNRKNEELQRNWGSMVANGQINTQAQMQPQQEMSPEQHINTLVEQYQEMWQPLGFSEEEYVDFVSRANQVQMTPHEVHKVVYFENYLSEAYKQGLEEGKRGMYNQIRTTGNGTPVYARPQETQRLPQESPEVEMFNAFSKGGLPYY